MRISTAIEFTASHAVASDPKSCEQHQHRWKLWATVEGTLSGPGWVMDFGTLRDALRSVAPLSSPNLNLWLDDEDATNERISLRFSQRLPRLLPREVTLVALDLFELDEAGNETNGVHWP